MTRFYIDTNNHPKQGAHSKVSTARCIALILSCVIPTLSLPVSAQQATAPETAPETHKNSDKGYEIARRSDHSDNGFTTSEVAMEMILHNATGKTSRRTMHQKTLEVPAADVGDKSLMIFNSPADVEGTALLSHAKILDPDNQWLFLPALKRVKRISSSNKSGPFVGSEFAFEDLTALELDKYTYTFMRSEHCGDRICDVVARYPRYENSGYTKQVTWIDQNDYQIRKIDFYDRRDEKLKTLELNDYKQYNGQYWRAHSLAMNNHQTGKSTELIYGDFVFKTALSDADFTKSVLKRLQ
jgi:outer membrane lipoprotein-sorting protein